MALTLKSLTTFFSAQREEDLYFSKLSKSNEIKIFAENVKIALQFISYSWATKNLASVFHKLACVVIPFDVYGSNFNKFNDPFQCADRGGLIFFKIEQK